MNLTGLITPKTTVHGVSIRALNFADISNAWQTKGTEIIKAYDTIVQKGESATSQDVVALVSDIIKFAPDLARDVFLAAIDDDGSEHEIGYGVFATAADVWDKHMGVGKQFEVLAAVFNLTVSESDTLKKTFKMLPVGQTTQMVTAAMQS